ncbi:glutamine synthetase [Rhodobacteraceae bacterium CCMM004]|nr:glutamine synthetase [Rhodobacteraceae bacterium CCMM004]
MSLPDGTRALRLACADLNGQARGKRLPAHMADKALAEGTRLPLSVLNLDISGADIEDSPLVFASGDPDGLARPTGRGPVPMPWLDTPTALIPVWTFHEDGRPFDGDPRQALAQVAARYAAAGLTPVVATELEFYLVDDTGDTPQPPRSPRSGKRRSESAILSVTALDAWDGFLTDLYAAAEAMGIPAEAAISEGGPGQFEINLSHVADPLRAADDAWLFKLAVKGLARRHGCAATFMAKPYPDAPGNGLHIHFSLLDRTGGNVFDDGGPQGTHALTHAVAGCLAAMAAATLICAPHGVSYDRLVPGAHAPTGIGWGYENRTAALRIPGGPAAARRIEHRVAGGDANPYLLIATVLAAALDGIEAAAPPPPPMTGNAYEADLPQMPATWDTALDLFATDPVVPRLLPTELIAHMVRTKRQEMALTSELDLATLTALYLDTA